MPDSLLATSEAANLLGVTRAQITRLCASGVLVSYRRGHKLAITRESIEYAREHRPKRGRPRKDKHAGTVRALRKAGYLGLAEEVKHALTDTEDIGRPD